MAGLDETAAGAPGGTRAVPPELMVLGGIASVQVGGAWAATLFDRLGAGGASLLRIGFAALMLWAVYRPSPRAARPQWRLVLAFGIVVGLMNYSFYESIARIPMGAAVTLEFAGPLGLAVLLSRRPADVAAAVAAAAGVVLITDPFGDRLDPAGAGLALFAGVCWALYILCAQATSRAFGNGDGLAMALVVASVVPLGPGIVQAGDALLDPWLLAAGVGIALAGSVIPFSLETAALRRMDARVFGVLMSLEPVAAVLAGLAILGQRAGATDLAGMALVVAASLAVTRRQAAPEA